MLLSSLFFFFLLEVVVLDTSSKLEGAKLYKVIFVRATNIEKLRSL